MGEWKTYRLGEIVTIKGGKRLPKGVNLIKIRNSHPYIRIRDIGKTKTIELDSTFEYVDDDTQKTIARYIVQEGDILISIVGTIGLVGIVGKSLDSANLTENCVKLTNLRGVERDFLFYFLKSEYGQNETNKGIVGAVQAKLPIKNIENIKIPLPSLEEQRRIAGILGSLDDKIELNRRINANLEAQAQALFRSWFVDFEPFRDGPFVDSELGKIPQGWKVETLSNLATVIKKGITPSNSETYSHYSIPAYDDAHFPEKQSGETIKSGKYIVYNNSILLSKLNPRIKRLWFIKTAEENAICSTEFIPIQTKDTELISFVFYLIDSDIFYQQALSLVNGATGSHQRFHAEDIMQIPFAWNKDAAIDFAQKANYILQKIEDNIRENQTLSALRDTMLPKLMAGEIAIE